MKRRPVSSITLFITVFASMVVHPISVLVFFIWALYGEIPWVPFFITALVFTIMNRRKLIYPDLKDINIVKLCIKSWWGIIT